MPNKISYFILTGEPGAGKTTLTKKLCLLLNKKGIKTIGFFTEEVRHNRVREGFDVVTLCGERGRLAREQSLLATPAKFTVGKYGVLVQEFENIAINSIKMPEANEPCVLVIDEIGKMEFFSTNFKSRIKEVFSTCSKNIVLATIPVRKSDPIIESIRNNSRSKVWTVTRENRNSIYEEIEKEVYMAIKTQIIVK